MKVSYRLGPVAKLGGGKNNEQTSDRIVLRCRFRVCIVPDNVLPLLMVGTCAG
jgi:hypothetical protein